MLDFNKNMTKIKPIVNLIFAVSLNFLYAQIPHSEIDLFLGTVGYVKETKNVVEKINDIEYNIWLINEKDSIQKTYSKTGTCFFVYTDLDQYLVTAEHVAKNTSLNTKIILPAPDSSPNIYRLGELVKEKGKLNWTNHHHADVSVILLDPEVVQKKLQRSILPFEFINPILLPPSRETDLTVFGYPLSLGTGRKISPITKISKPSSGLIDLNRFDNKNPSIFFLLDDPTVSGFSGGPVLKLPPTTTSRTHERQSFKDYKIEGLVHGTINSGSGGFTAIVPSMYIKETIEAAPGHMGSFTYSYPKGNTWSERIYKSGNPWTVVSNFDAKGNVQEKGTLFEGNGSLYIYDEKSKLILIKHYKDGHLVKN